MVAIGGLVGLLSKNSAGTISSSNSSSSINSSGVYVAAGGLVGDEFSDLQYINYGQNTRIQDSFSSGSVNLKDTNSKPENVNFGYGNFIIAGGLIGHNIGTITNSHSTSNVSVNTNSYTTIMMGGLSGFNEGASDMTPVYSGSISNSYSLGKLSFAAQNPSLINAAIGGLSGVNAGNIDSSYAIKNFDNPLVIGPTLVGGLVGSNGFGASISKSYSINDIKFSSAAYLTDSIKNS